MVQYEIKNRKERPEADPARDVVNERVVGVARQDFRVGEEHGTGPRRPLLLAVDHRAQHIEQRQVARYGGERTLVFDLQKPRLKVTILYGWENTSEPKQVD